MAGELYLLGWKTMTNFELKVFFDIFFFFFFFTLQLFIDNASRMEDNNKL